MGGFHGDLQATRGHRNGETMDSLPENIVRHGQHDIAIEENLVVAYEFGLSGANHLPRRVIAGAEREFTFETRVESKLNFGDPLEG